MSRPPRRAIRPGRLAAHGVVAIELAIILSFTYMIIPALFIIGGLLYRYQVAHHAALDAARYLASQPKVTMANATLSSQAQAVAASMVERAIAHASAGVTPPGQTLVAVRCGDYHTECGTQTAPATFSVNVSIQVVDRAFGHFSYRWLPGSNVDIQVFSRAVVSAGAE